MNRPPIATHCHPLPGASVAREFAALKIATSLLKSRCISTARISETLRLLALLLAKGDEKMVKAPGISWISFKFLSCGSFDNLLPLGRIGVKGLSDLSGSRKPNFEG